VPERAQQHAPVDELRWSAPFERLETGQRFHAAARTVRETDVLVFAALTGDRHPQHCDAEWASESRFGERIAHGLLILALAVGLVPLDPERVLALRRIRDVVFKRPVRLDETIELEGELTELHPIDDRAGLAIFRWAVRNQDRALVCRATVELLWRRDTPSQRADTPAFWHASVMRDIAPGTFIPLPL
jgi:3-hydroxybutyryl-CoA dehydratase